MSEEAQYARHFDMLANGEVQPGQEHDPRRYISPGEMAYYESVAQEQSRMTTEHNNLLFDPVEDDYYNEPSYGDGPYDHLDNEPAGDDFMPDELYTEDGEIIDAAPNAFNPNRFLTKVSGQDYLEVKWRLLWLRTDHPNASIETEMATLDGQMAVFRAKVSIPGRGSATGWGSEEYSDFRDFIEKAETKAVGRALAALGFGTQFSKDYEFGADDGRVVDSPVRTQQTQQGQLYQQASITRPTGPQNAPQLPPKPDNYNGPSEKQLAWILGLEKDIDQYELGVIYDTEGIDRLNLTGGRGGTASRVIDILNARKKGMQQ